MAYSVQTNSMLGAVIGASLYAAVVTQETRIAFTTEIIQIA